MTSMSYTRSKQSSGCQQYGATVAPPNVPPENHYLGSESQQTDISRALEQYPKQSAVCTCQNGSGTSVSSTVPTCGPTRQNYRPQSPNFSEDSLSEENCPCPPPAAAGGLLEEEHVLVLRKTSHQQRENRRSLTQEYLLNVQLHQSSEAPRAVQLQQSSEAPRAVQLQQSSEASRAVQLQQSSEAPRAVQLQQSSEAPRAVQLQQSSETPRAALSAQQDGLHGTACPAVTGVRIRPSDRRTLRAAGRRHVPEIQLMPMPNSNGWTQSSASDSNDLVQPSGSELRLELVDADAVELRGTQSRPHIVDIRRRSLQTDALLRGIEGFAVIDSNIDGDSIATSAHGRRCSVGDEWSDHGGRVDRHQSQHRASLPATGVHLQRSASRAYDERPCASSAREKSAGAVRTWWEETRSSSKPNSQTVLMRRGSVGGRLQAISTSTRSIPAAIKTCNKSPASAPAAAASRRSSQSQRRMAFTVQQEDTHVEEDAEGGAGGVGLGIGEDGVKHRQRRTPTQAQSDTGEAATRCKTSANNGIDMLTSRRKRPGAPGYHSEGYFSSDQDVLEPANVATDVVREGRKLSLRSSAAGICRNASTVKTRTPSPRRNGTSAIQRPSRNSSAAGVTARTAPSARGGLRRSSTLGTVPVAAHRHADAAPVIRDDVSEAGTYTIDNDNANDMDETPGDEEAGATAAIVDLRRAGDDSSKDGSPDRDTETSSKPSAYSSSGSNWIEQWAAEVTRHNQQNLTKRTLSGSGVSKPPSGSGGSSAGVRSPVEADECCSNATANAGSTSTRSQHQRRKLPTPPRTVAMVSPGAVDTSSYLRTTEDVVCALQARLDNHNVCDSAGRQHIQQQQTGQSTRPDCQDLAVTDDSASERGETRCRQRQQLRRPASGSTRPVHSTTAEFKFNRALSLRRARLGLDDGSSAAPCRVASSITSTVPHNPGSSVAARRASSQAVDTRSCSSAGGFARSDGGRFSLRATNGAATSHKTNSSTAGAVRKSTDASGATRGGSRSSLRSSLTVQQQARSQELANWRRRKNYDPLKAARQDKQSKTVGGATEEKRGVCTAPSTGGTTASDRSSCRGGPLRSASFHGTALTGGQLGDSGDGDACPPCPLQRQGTTGPGGGLYSSGYRRATYRTGPTTAAGHHDANTTHTASAPAPAAKKALDNLVISTIHTLSGQIKLNAELLVSKLKCGFEEDDVRYTLLDDVLTTLSADIPGATRAPSRDLAVILKNLRKLELTVQVLDQVLCDDDEEDVDVDDCDLSDLEAEMATEDVSAAVDASSIHQLKSTKFGDGFY